MNTIISAYWSYIPNSLRKVFLVTIQLADGSRAEACGKTEIKAYEIAERFYGV